MSANVCIIIAIVVYLGAMLYVGFAFSKMHDKEYLHQRCLANNQ